MRIAGPGVGFSSVFGAQDGYIQDLNRRSLAGYPASLAGSISVQIERAGFRENEPDLGTPGWPGPRRPYETGASIAETPRTVRGFLN